MRRLEPRCRLALLISIVGVNLMLAVAYAPPSASAAMSNCTLAAVTALGIPNMTITSVADVLPPPFPEYCQVKGFLKTTGFGAPDGSAGFEVRMPAAWNRKLVFWGVGGLAGATFADIAINGPDFAVAVGNGYATAITDTGHQAGGTDASWAILAPGAPDRAKVIDYYFRATHQVTVAAKQLVNGFYTSSGQHIQRAYFDGCSNGGRQAMVQATHFPHDYDGIIAGAPFLDIRVILAGIGFQKTQLESSDTYIPFAKLAMIDAAVYASCDAADGVVDHLIQNPAHCAFDPHALVTSTCTPSSPTCLTAGQANTLKRYLTALHDDDGRLIYNGQSVSDLGGLGGAGARSIGGAPPFTAPIDFTAREPWGDAGFFPAPLSWQFVDHILQFLVERNPSFNARDFDVRDGVVGDGALRLFDRRTEAGDGDIPETLIPFIKMDKKLLMYHGFSDPALPAFRTIKFYEDLEKVTRGGYRELQENVRLFMVPGMQHCGGGPGPNVFDTLTALDTWVEGGGGPDAIIATNTATARTMPLCKFPEQARYKGAPNPMNTATSWTCSDGDQRLLQVGPNGRQAGLGERDRDDDHSFHDRDLDD